MKVTNFTEILRYDIGHTYLDILKNKVSIIKSTNKIRQNNSEIISKQIND